FLAVGCSEKEEPQRPSTTAAVAPSATPQATPRPSGTEITMLYSSEKKEWMEAAGALFQKAHPEIKLTLTAMGSLDAIKAITQGREKPTIFSPADSLVQNLLAHDWKAVNKSDLFATSGDDAPQPVVITPLVFVAWEDRGAVLLKASGGHIG